ncbi:unnamed protein product [Paramecium sonneborni]|uniref:Uncharacterized protein n=1 Tax=Paramecium sonneborni TaxID=65129 RepID=A0A8S1RMK9_9CILI|nr:unnamed protein product [Paramecium sonneborni]
MVKTQRLPHREGVFWSKNIGSWDYGKKDGIGQYEGSYCDYYLGYWENCRCS